MVDALVGHGYLVVHELAQGHRLAAAARHLQPQHGRQVGSRGPVEPHHQRDIFLGAVHVQQAGGVSGRSRLHGPRDVVLGDAVQRGLLFVHQQAILGLVVFHVPIHVHHAVGALPQVADAPRDSDPLLERRPVDLRHQRFEHRRPGRHFRHLDARSEALRDGQETLPHLFGDLVALQFAIALGQQVDLDIGHVRTAAHVIVAYQAVEVVGGGGAHVGLQVDDLGLLQCGAAQRIGRTGGLFERGSVRHVHDHLELALVVERQHLHFHELDIEERDRAEQQHDHTGEKAPAQPRCCAGSCP